MSAGLGSTHHPNVGTISPGHDRHRDRWFFSGMALAALATVFIGFAPSYYLKPLYDTPPLPPLVHLHGVLFTGWVLLFIGQTSLVAARRTDLHRRLGVAGAALAVAMLVVGFLTAVGAARRGISPPGGPPPLVFLVVPLFALLVFAALAGTGLRLRRRSETHKRLMLLATIGLLTPAIARMSIGPGGPAVNMGITALFVVACLVYDRVAHGRVHPAFLWGGGFLLLSFPLRLAVGRTDAWLSFAEWLVS